MNTKIKAISKVSLTAILALGVTHYASHFWVYGEQLATDYAIKKKNESIDYLATSFGYERPTKKLADLELKTQEQIIQFATKKAIEKNVNPSLVIALMRVESAYKTKAVSDKGAVGLMQVMPTSLNVKRCGLRRVEELTDTATNIECGIEIFKQELASSSYNPSLALITYNGGTVEQQRKKCRGDICSESLRHARKVLQTLSSSTLEYQLLNKPEPLQQAQSDTEKLEEEDRAELDRLIKKVG